jgi:hypothetical protein
MNKDKLRSVITVSMLACSVLILSALFIGCPQPTWQVQLKAAQIRCPHTEKAAYYHHPTTPPHDSTLAAFDWYKSPPPPCDPTGMPAPQPCPVDPALTNADSLKCTVCGAKLWP